jgi:hypothetical protein
MDPLMGRATDKTALDVFKADQERIRDLAALLTRHGPGGRFGTAETVRWLLNQRQDRLDTEHDAL